MRTRKRAAKRRPKKAEPARRVRKTFLVEQDKIDYVRKAFDLRSDAEVLRFALDHLLSHFEQGHDEEE